MCGIFGIYYPIPQLSDSQLENELILCGSKLEHRGPDANGKWIDSASGIGLYHSRLSILELTEHGSQPMISATGRYIITFNGEIYNHRNLRSEIERVVSVQWRGASDTETLLASIEIWGIEETLKKISGMFAFALFDREARVLSLCRDRVGEKPLYYGFVGTGSSSALLFGSELKAFRAHPKFSAEISRDSLSLYMRHSNVPAPYSIYDNIFKLLPGTFINIKIDEVGLVKNTYWSGATVARNGLTNKFTGTANDAVDLLDNLLIETIGQQMCADVPIGAFLSGGIDSSLIASIMQSQSMRKISTFTIGFSEADYNEAVYAKDISKFLGTDHNELYVSPSDARSIIPRLPTVYDEPFADSSQIPTILVCELAKKHVTVALSGDGGDELFAGYNRYQITAKSWKYLSKLPRNFRSLLGSALQSLRPDTWNSISNAFHLSAYWADLGYKIHKGGAVLASDSPFDLYQSLTSLWDRPSDLVINSCEPPTLLTGNMPSLDGLNDIEKMMALDMITYLPDDILTKVDRAAMSLSLETRVPFLDPRVIEYAWSLPLNYKLRKSEGKLITKWPLRQVLSHYLPANLIERPKMGFGVPIDHWLRGPLREWAESMLSESRIRQDGYFNYDLIRKRWVEHLDGRRNWQHSLWCVLMFQAWLSDH